MKAAVFKGKDFPFQVIDVPRPRPVKDQVLIRLSHAALNHRDLWALEEIASIPQFAGVILGSDGCGVIEEVGEDADPLLIGAEVVIYPSLDWGNNPAVQGDSFRILGNPDNGTFAEFIVISKKYVFEKPEHLTAEESAAVPLSGLTAYRALFTKARLRAKEKVLITGIGGGAALWALQLALSYQARVYVTSGSADKLDRVRSMGVQGAYNYKDPSWTAAAQKDAGGFDVIIDSSGGSDFASLVELAVPGGRIVNFGRTAGPTAQFTVRSLYWKQVSVFGTTMGTRDEFLSLLEMIESRGIKPVLDKTFPLDQVSEAFARMKQGQHFGKIVLSIPK